MVAEIAREIARGLGYGFRMEAAFFRGLFAPLIEERRQYRAAIERLKVPPAPNTRNPLVYMFNGPKRR